MTVVSVSTVVVLVTDTVVVASTGIVVVALADAVEVEPGTVTVAVVREVLQGGWVWMHEHAVLMKDAACFTTLASIAAGEATAGARRWRVLFSTLRAGTKMLGGCGPRLTIRLCLAGG